MIGKKWVRAASKAMASFGLLLVLLAPLQGVLQVSVAYAQTGGSGGAPATEPPAGTIGNTTQQAQHDSKALDMNDFCSGSGWTASTCLSGIIYLFAVYIPSNFAYITAQVFNFGVQLALNSASYALQFLSQGWAVVRDIANLAFIFILIYIAYTLIFQAETAGTMQTLAWVIVMALLINFSFFISRVVIDAGNILAVQFYNAISINDPTGQNPNPVIPSPLGGSLQQTNVKDLTAGLMNVTQVQGILSDASFQSFMHRDNNQSGPGTFFTNLGILSLVFIAIGILFALLGFVFLMVGVKFLVRIVVLWFAIIAAPLAFAARALPGNRQMMGYYHTWEKHLVQSSFYPAVFLFLFYIMTLFTNAMAGTNGLIPSIFSAANSQSNLAAVSVIANVVIRVGLIVVLLFYAMKFSDSFSEEGSAAARSVVSWTGSKVTGATASISARVGRNTVGRAADAIGRSETMRNFASRSPLVGGAALSGVKSVASSNFDIRGTSGLRSVLTGVNKKLGTRIDAGKPSGQGGFVKQDADQAKRIERIAKQTTSSAVDVENAQKAFQEEYNQKHGANAYENKVEELEKITNEGAEKAQEAFKQQYDKEHGPGSFTRDVAHLRNELDQAKAAVLTGGTEGLQKQAAATVDSYQEKLKELEEAGKRHVEKSDTELKQLQSEGSRRVATLDKSRLESLANRVGERNLGNLYMPSPKSQEVALKIKKAAAGEAELSAHEEPVHKTEPNHIEAPASEHHEEHAVHAEHHEEEHADHGHDHGAHSDEHHDDHGHHLTLTNIRAAAQAPGGLEGQSSAVLNKIAERLKETNRLNEAMLEEVKTQNSLRNRPAAPQPQQQQEANGEIRPGVNKDANGKLSARNVNQLVDAFKQAQTSPPTPQQPPAPNTQPPKPPQTPPPTNPGQNPEKK